MGNCIGCNSFHITREELKLGIIEKMKIKILTKVNLDKQYDMLDANDLPFSSNFLKENQVLTCSEDLILTLESTASTFRNRYNPDYTLYEILDDGTDEDNAANEIETPVINESDEPLDSIL